MKNKLWDIHVEEIPCSECPYSKLTAFSSSFTNPTLKQGYICKKQTHGMTGVMVDNKWSHISIDHTKSTYCEHLADYFMAGNDDIFRKIWNSKIL